MKLQRYSRIFHSLDPREIVLLKSFPCRWGRCAFCSYIGDNCEDAELINKTNESVLKQVTGEFKVLEVINSGSCFEIPNESLEMIKRVLADKAIEKLYLESHWHYRKRLDDMRLFFGIPIIFITGIETFDAGFRNDVLGKGVEFKCVEEIKQFFDSVCIMVGMRGQTKAMISRDVEILLENFDHGTINLFVENNTAIKPDLELQEWFKNNFAWLNDVKKIDVLWQNTDFGVGTVIDE